MHHSILSIITLLTLLAHLTPLNAHPVPPAPAAYVHPLPTPALDPAYTALPSPTANLPPPPKPTPTTKTDPFATRPSDLSLLALPQYHNKMPVIGSASGPVFWADFDSKKKREEDEVSSSSSSSSSLVDEGVVYDSIPNHQKLVDSVVVDQHSQNLTTILQTPKTLSHHLTSPIKSTITRALTTLTKHLSPKTRNEEKRDDSLLKSRPKELSVPGGIPAPKMASKTGNFNSGSVQPEGTPSQKYHSSGMLDSEGGWLGMGPS
ncbi:MAG: hypothetical protein M1812_005174 [Candelaria pacifica]|nr:MAG: hypothetical protein M1812_005174 [Candelaria pacifica]